MSSALNNFTTFNAPSLNGLVDINSDNVTTTTLSSNDMTTTTLNVNGRDISTIISNVDANTQKLTGITYTATPTPTTKSVNDIDETGTIYIRDPSNPTLVYLRIAYEPSLYGFSFTDETPGRIMNFRVKNANGVGYKLFYFASSQLYANMLAYIDNWLTVSYNNMFIMGDANNAGVWNGASQKYVPNTADTSGLIFYNKGLNNNAVYYTNFTHNDPFNVQLYTFRMNYNNIWSKVNHTFEKSLIGQDATFATTLNVNGTSTLKAINGTSLYITGTSTFNNTVIADSLSIYNATNLNGNLNAISTSNFIGTATFNGQAIFNNSINAGYGSFTTLLLSSGLTCGSINCAGDILAYGSLTINGGFPNTLTGSLIVNNTISTSDTFTQTGITASTNRIIQPRIALDITTYPNILKYTQIRYNSGSATDKPALQCIDDTGGRSLNFCPNVGSGSYGPLMQTNDRLIIAVNGDGSASALDLSTYGPSGKHGIRIYHTSATDYTTQLNANTYNFSINSINGISANVGTNTLNINSTNTTISGPVTFSNNVTANGSTALNGAVLLGTTTLLNNNILQYGSSIINQDMSGTFSGTNQLKLTNIFQYTSASGSATPILLLRDDYNLNSLMFLPNSGPSSFNPLSSTNSQSIISRGDVTDNASFVLSTWSTLKNGIKISASSSTNAQVELYAGNSSSIILNNATGITLNNTASITYTDSTVQTTAYTTAKDTKLNAIGSTTVATLSASTTLTTGAFFNCGSLSLSAGTYILTLNCCMSVITGATTVSQLLMSPSTSSTALSSNTNLCVSNGGAISYGVGAQWVLATSAIVSPTTTTIYYMLCQAGFGTANRLQFANGNSSFKAVRIA